jgi:hypothetical protein
MSSLLSQNKTNLQEILTSVNSLPNASVAQAAPVISVDSSNGLITATAGAKSSTHQLAFQPAKTITPGAQDQIAVSKGYFTGGNITVAGDGNLAASNIRSGVSIFGVSGSYAVEAGETVRAIVTRSISSYTNSRVTLLGDFALCLTPLTTAYFPNVIALSGAFALCYSLITASFPQVATINEGAFYKCYNLKSLYLPGSSICQLLSTDAFTSTPIGGYSASAGCYGSIYVPASLVTSYQTATNWTYFSSRFVALQSGTGEGATTFQFYIDDIAYEAEEGMTWADWVNSNYNTGGYKLVGSDVTDRDSINLIDANGHTIKASSLITEASYYVDGGF